MRITATALLISLLLFCGCAKRMEIGPLEYYHVVPRTPSVPVISPERTSDDDGRYTAIWGVLGTVKPDGPIMKPISIRIGGETRPVTNWKYRLQDHRYYYWFEVPGPLGKGFPHDWGTGNLFSQDPETRTRNPIQITFIRQHDQSTWIGLGTVEQASMLDMQAARDVIASDSR